MNTYQVIDEPQHSKMSKVTVNPMWPLLSSMVGGALFGWLWFAVNSFALNSPNRGKELLTIVIALFVFVAAHVATGIFLNNGYLKGIPVDYVILILLCMKLVFSYKLFLMQMKSFSVYTHFEGKVANPVAGLILAYLAGRKVEFIVADFLLSWGQ
ncbi:hypothetical protein G3R49_00200 [Shewanella sp. WXL01]|uniref:hypothetical protein n=1 Tax=Shewanella sp. WXL01 TaxID=2709721 RepID=UPI0014383EA8|nr:hypothetical protein [Shewanella sp. WXL01]NKF48995.1 hypothetical protein [Shewanella sp. WXL01]